MNDDDVPPLDEETLETLAGQIGELPEEQAGWVAQLYLECQRARAAEARLLEASQQAADCGDSTQLVLDTADWLRTLWEVGYMGGEAFPKAPRSDFPSVSVEDILKSALFARIRCGKRPLPFPPPTRDGVPWHEVVESDQPFAVRAQVANEGWANIEGCADWQRISALDGDHCVQHRGKGPLYRLTPAADGQAILQRLPATQARRLLRQSRGGIDAYLLEWPKDGGEFKRIPLRAANWERAENEALRWIAVNHPDLYGQIRFERGEL